MIEKFLLVLMVCSTVTTLTVEATKIMLGERKASYNLIAAIESIIIAGAVSAGYIILKEVAITPKVVVLIVALILFSWLCSMLGFDKVKQMILQIKSN